MKSLDQMLGIILNEETELPPKVKLCALRVNSFSYFIIDFYKQKKYFLSSLKNQ